MDGRDLMWRSPVGEPQPTQDFLATFGGFLQHCGILGVGGPGPADTHALHGELPNAPFQEAWIVGGADERGDYLGVGGAFTNAAAFGQRYRVETALKVYPASALMRMTIGIKNEKATPMEMFYLAHINFRPVDHGRLVYSAQRTPEHVRVRTEVPSHIKAAPGYGEMLQRLAKEPALHETMLPGQQYDPEAVFFIDYDSDAEGWAHTLQVLPDGSADYVRHRPVELPKVTRWISRTPNQDSLAMAELGTSEPEGATRERAKGNANVLAAGEEFWASYDLGALSAEEAKPVVEKVSRPS
jgi:hypothetical protein